MVNALGSKVIIELEKDDYVEKNGILMPTKQLMREFMKKKEGKREIGGVGYDNHIRHGVVTSTGPETNQLEVKDSVIFNRHNGEEFEIDGKKYLAIEEIDIALIYRK